MSCSSLLDLRVTGLLLVSAGLSWLGVSVALKVAAKDHDLLRLTADVLGVWKMTFFLATLCSK